MVVIEATVIKYYAKCKQNEQATRERKSLRDLDTSSNEIWGMLQKRRGPFYTQNTPNVRKFVCEITLMWHLYERPDSIPHNIDRHAQEQKIERISQAKHLCLECHKSSVFFFINHTLEITYTSELWWRQRRRLNAFVHVAHSSASDWITESWDHHRNQTNKN